VDKSAKCPQVLGCQVRFRAIGKILEFNINFKKNEENQYYGDASSVLDKFGLSHDIFPVQTVVMTVWKLEGRENEK